MRRDQPDVTTPRDGAEPDWLVWARRLAAIAQTGLEYADGGYDAARYRDVRDIAAAMLARGGWVDPPVAVDVLGGDRGYATPKVDVRGFVVRAPNRVLLVREREDGRWTLPGGWADVTDTPAQAAEREVAEEAGYRVRAIRLLACWDRTRQRGAAPIPYRAYKLVFLCEVLGEVARDHSETDAVDWFAADDLPPMSVGRSNPEQIVRLLELAADPALPADFH